MNDVTLILNCVKLLKPGNLPLYINRTIISWFTKYSTEMKNSLYVLSIILVIAWVIGYYGTNIGDIIHILLVMAVIALIIRVINDEKLFKKIKIKL